MIDIRQTATFTRWLKRLKDGQARARITVRVFRLASGNPGDVRPIGEGLSELRIDYGPGYRVYFMRSGAMVIVLLCGGDKRTQDKDIVAAKSLAKAWKE